MVSAFTFLPRDHQPLGVSLLISTRWPIVRSVIIPFLKTSGDGVLMLIFSISNFGAVKRSRIMVDDFDFFFEEVCISSFAIFRVRPVSPGMPVE